ncbi:MAG: DUF4476 domain-containing protein [Niabella sp.]
MMKRFLLAWAILLTAAITFAQYSVQSKYFVYLQTEPAQPFYIKINGQQLSANASGYLILPQLKDGDYKLVVGFPQEKYPQQTYDFTIDSKDKGYLIKDFGADGWGLFDLQTMAVQKPLKAGEGKAIVNNSNPVATSPATMPKEDVSDFTKVLSKAANDPGLLEKPVPAPEPEPKKEVVVVEQPKPKPVEPEPQKVEESVSSAPVEQPIVEKPVEQPKVVEAIQQESSTSQNKAKGQAGIMVEYANNNDKGQPEPVTIFIPEPQNKKEIKPEPVTEKTVDPTPVIETVQQNTIEEKKPEKFEVEEKPAIQEEVVKEKPKRVVKTNPDCKKIADDGDFLKLRRQMSQKDTDDGMIGQAKNAFRNRCFTTNQIKYLSSMFLSNAGKYNFYEAAYPHISDIENFETLRDEIKDAYYAERFDEIAIPK